MHAKEAERGVMFTPGGDVRFTGGFVQVPSAILRSRKLEPGEKTLYALLLDYAWGKGEAFPSQGTLADDIGRGERHVRSWLHHLEQLDLIRIQRRGLNKPNVYWIVNPSPKWLEDEFRTYLEARAASVAERNSSADQERPLEKDRNSNADQESRNGSLVPVPDRNQGADEVDTPDKMLLFPKDKRDASASGNPGSLSPSESQEINTARVRTQKTKALGNPDIKPLLERHQQLYTGKIGAPLLLSWGRDGATMKRLLGVYSRAEVERLQDAYFAQPTDSFAGRQGYSMAEFAREVPALMTQIKANEELTESQRGLVEAIKGQGVREATALALVREFPEDEIQRQLQAHEGRRDSLRNPAAALVRAIREQWAVPEETEPDYFQPLSGVPAAAEGPPPEIDSMMTRTVAHFTGKAAVSSGRT